MLISPAWAHGSTDTSNSGGGAALLIILAVAIVVALLYVAQKKWRGHLQVRDRDSQ
jgi:Tfp pilus assembly protein PilX